MGQKKYPPLTPAEAVAIVTRLGFVFKRQDGSHAQYERLADEHDPQRRVVTIDMGYPNFDDKILKSMISQSGKSREEFYGATKRTAKRAGVAVLKLTPEVDGD